MRVYHDWEFLESGSTNTVKPISVGMVAEDGSELYYEFYDAPWDEIKKHKWLMDNVVPALTSRKGSYADYENVVKSRLIIANRVQKFLYNASKADPENELQLWGWYSSYDHVCLGQLFGSMVKLPSFIPMWTNDLRQEVQRLGNPRIPELRLDSEVVHNALDDARAEKRMGDWIVHYNAEV